MITLYGEPMTEDALARLSDCVAAAQERGERTLVFCEDALTLLAERAVLRDCGATFQTEVTTFARFLSGAGQVLSKQGSVAAVTSILIRCKGKLARFSPSAAEAVYETIAQLAASRVGSDDLRRGAEQAEGTLRDKLSDLALVFDEYTAFLREHELLDENGYLALLPDRLRACCAQADNLIFFGFSSFTKQGIEGIRTAALCAHSLTGILPASRAVYDTGESVRAFREACDGCEVTFVQGESSLKGEAERLRRGLFSAASAAQKPVQAENVFLSQPQDEAAEARAICAAIRRAIDGGKRWRDIAVLAPASGFPVLEKAFDAYKIPYFADVKRSFLRHPFCAFTADVLRAVADGGTPASVDAVASNVCFGESDAYRNYLAKYGGWRGAYKSALRADAKDFGDPAVLAAAHRRMGQVLGVLPARGTGRAFIEGIRALRTLTDADATCDALAASFEGAERDFLSLKPLDGLLDEIDVVAGDRTFGAREFSVLFSGAADALKRAMIPVLADAVFLGDAVASRFGRVDIVFVAGATDALPPAGEDTALITDREIAKLGEQGVDIRPAIAVVNARARESLARNVCSFREQLYVSRPVSICGKETVAGELFASCASLFRSAPLPDPFPYLCAERIPALLAYLRGSAAFERAASYDESFSSSIWAALERSGEGEILRMIEGSAKKSAGEIGSVIDGAVSPTLLETYFNCPYKGFLSGVLRLSERDEASSVARGAGTFLHEVLERIAPELDTLPDEDACRARAGEIAQALYADARYTVFGGSKAGDYSRARLVAVCRKAAADAWRSVHISPFRIRAEETGIRLADLGVTGKADRVDEADGYVRIIDYKTGSASADATAYYTGRNLQLELYLLSVAQDEKPAGAFYFAAKDEFSKADEKSFLMSGFYDNTAPVFEREREQQIIDGKGGMTAKEFSDFLGYSRLVVQGALEELRNGEIAPSPYDGACDYCPFRGACGYDGPARKESSVKPQDIAAIADKANGRGV